MREAANLLTHEFESEHPDTQWKMTTGMRNYSGHEYFQVDNTVIWDVIQSDLPNLETHIKDYLQDL